MVTSSISWIDFSETDRRKMIEVIALFKEHDTRDELGLGSIRDTFAELFFPGTSTLQTRVRYFLFVPWLYQYFETHRSAHTPVEQRLRANENQLITVLKAANEDGVIGQRSGTSLQRYPSSIYWNGLRRWGILRYTGSQSQYHRWLDSGPQGSALRTEVNDEPVEGWRAGNWNPGFPEAPEDFLRQTTFTLSHPEAAYLRERLQYACSDSLLATLVENCAPVDAVAFIWEHPQWEVFPEHQRQWMQHARAFSTLMYGATLLYNLMLAELAAQEAWATSYQERLSQWQELFLSELPVWKAWERTAFWRLIHTNAHIPVFTERFVNRWLDLLLLNSHPPNVAQDTATRTLIRERETSLKHSRSRFESRRHLELWSGAAGIDPLDFRWRIARRLTNDILHGLAG